MAITETEHEHEDAHEGGHHETPEQRDQKERIALYLLIAGDALFLLLEIFAWFYLRALHTNGLWNGAACTKANPCTNGIALTSNPNGLDTNITHVITRASWGYSALVAGLAVAAALFAWGAESSARGRRSPSAMSVLFFVFLLGAIGAQIWQFQTVPFTTVEGTYASTYLFFMGSTLAHLLLLGFIGLGLMVRAQKKLYDDGAFYRIRLIRIFAAWIAISAVLLTLVSSLFA